MKKEYGKALRQLFAKRMQDEWPLFRETKVKTIYLFPGERAFLWVVSEQLYCWVVLSPSPKDYDQFTLLIGWSMLGRYPELNAIPSTRFPSADHEEFTEQEYLIRLPMLWTDKDPWWVVRKFKPARNNQDLLAQVAPIAPQQAIAQVMPRVDEALEKLRSHGIPYLRAFINSQKPGN
ncbi:MAG: hypothetical protein ABW076_02640 [Candidatus Thiodiazotropha sp.]